MTATHEMEQRIRSFIADSFFVEDIASSDSFMNQRILDSIGVLELIYFIEETWGFKIADEELIPDNLDSIDEVVAFVRRKTATEA